LNEVQPGSGQGSQQQQQAAAHLLLLPIAPLPQGTVPLAQIEDFNGLQNSPNRPKEAKRFAQQQLARSVTSSPFRLGDQILDRRSSEHHHHQR
jgi:hypothetical protein